MVSYIPTALLNFLFLVSPSCTLDSNKNPASSSETEPQLILRYLSPQQVETITIPKSIIPYFSVLQHASQMEPDSQEYFINLPVQKSTLAKVIFHATQHTQKKDINFKFSSNLSEKLKEVYGILQELSIIDFLDNQDLKKIYKKALVNLIKREAIEKRNYLANQIKKSLVIHSKNHNLEVEIGEEFQLKKYYDQQFFLFFNSLKVPWCSHRRSLLVDKATQALVLSSSKAIAWVPRPLDNNSSPHVLKIIKNVKGALALSPDGQFLASTNASGKILICYQKDSYWYLSQILDGDPKHISDLTFHPTKDILASCGSFSLKLWKLIEGKWQQAQYLSGHTDLITTIAFSPNGVYLASGSRDETVGLWEFNSQKEKWKLRKIFTEPTDIIHCLAWRQDSKILVGGSMESIIGWKGVFYLWNINSLPIGPGKKQMTPHKYGVEFLAFCGNKIASAGIGNKICLWGLDDGKHLHLLRTIKIPVLGVKGLLFYPTSKNLIIAGPNMLYSEPLYNVEKVTEFFDSLKKKNVSLSHVVALSSWLAHIKHNPSQPFNWGHFFETYKVLKKEEQEIQDFFELPNYLSNIETNKEKIRFRGKKYVNNAPRGN